MKALVLGCGSIGSRHARNLMELGAEVCVHDPDVGRMAGLARTVGAAAAEDRDGTAADLVVIATPTNQHVDDLEWALAQGLDVFLEKPVGANRVQLERARGAAERAGDRVVMVGCNMRFTNGYRMLAKSIPRVGRMLSIQASFGWHLPSWRPHQDYRRTYSSSFALGGGVILDAIHEIDYVLSLAGPALSVTACCKNTETLDIDVEDLAELVIDHQGGVVSAIHLDYLQRTYTRSCRVVGTDATLCWDYAAHRLDVLGPGQDETLLEHADLDPNAMYVAEMESFLAAVRAEGPNANNLANAVKTLEVALTALEHGRR